MISSSRRWLQNARTLLSLAHQPLRCCSPSSTPSQQRLRRVLLWQSRRLEIDFEKMFDLVSISAREGKLGLEKNSRKTPHCPASINARDVSSRMAACLLVGRQRTASRTVGTSSSFACSVDAIRNQPLWSSSSSRRRLAVSGQAHGGCIGNDRAPIARSLCQPFTPSLFRGYISHDASPLLCKQRVHARAGNFCNVFITAK